MFRVEGQVSHTKTMAEAWLASEFEGGVSAPKVEKMEEIDRRYHAAREA